MAPLCKFYQQGNCRNGANCRFEHPGANANPFGSNNNRFSALNTGGGSSGGAFGRTASTGADGTNVYKITKDAIKIDLVDERPQWILSAYGPGRDAPEQLFGGYPREQSFEEIRLSVLSSPNPQQALQEVQNMYMEAEKQMQAALGNLDGAVQFILAAENKHPNRHDVCRQGTNEGATGGTFAVGGGSSGAFGSNLSSGSSASPFGAAQSSPFGAAASAAPTTSAFGQPSQMGAKANPFGQPSSLGTSAFGQPSSLGASAFGQPSSLGAKPNPFGAAANAPSGFAAAAQQQGSAFGQTSALGAKPNPFGAPASSSPFGAPAQNQNASPFGAPSQTQGASPFGAPAQGAQPTPFGAPAQASNPSPFGAPSQPSNPSPFGAPSQPSTSSPFGAPAQTSQASSFGAPSQTQNANPFGASAQPAAAAAAAPSPFGQPSSLGVKPSPFGATPAASNPFSSAGTPNQAQPNAAPNPFGQPVTNGIGGAPSNAPNGFGGMSAQPTAQQAPSGAAASGSPYPPGSAKQHPNIDSYASRMGTRLIRFKNMPIAYKDDKPGVQNGRTWTKIWFPNGPPNYYADTEPLDKAAYTEQVHKIYEESARTGRFVDAMPEVPPMREDCVWDF